VEFALGGCRYPEKCRAHSALEAPSLAAEPRWVEGTPGRIPGAAQGIGRRLYRLPPQEGYFTLSTVMVSPLNLPLIVTSLPAIGVTFAWSAIL
jgi:hypothetical protein